MTLSVKEKLCTTAVDGLWRQLTKLGNAAFAVGNDVVALAHYEEACLEAEAILSAELRAGASGPSIGPMLATIATHNLAELIRRSNAPRASRLLEHAVERLIELADNEHARAAVRIHAARNLRPAIEEVLADAAARQGESEQASLVTRAREAALRVYELFSNEST